MVPPIRLASFPVRALAAFLALATALSGCRLFTPGKEIANSKSVEGEGWNEQAFDFAVGEESVLARDSVLAFAETIGAAYIGKYKSRPDAPVGSALKSDYQEFLSNDAASDLQKELVKSMEGDTASSHFEFLGCNLNPFGKTLRKVLFQDITRILAADYDGLVEADITAGPEARAKCGRLIENPEKDKTVHVEFYIDGEPGKMFQYVQVRRVREGGSLLDFKTPPAIFRARKPLRPNVALVVRAHSGMKKLAMQLLPAGKPFSAQTAKVARTLLGLNLSGLANNDPEDLADLSRQWFAGQVHAEQTKAAFAGFQAALIVVSAGNFGAALGAVHAAVATGAPLSGLEITALIVHLGATGFGMVNEIIDMTQFRESVAMMDNDRERKAFETSLLIINTLGVGFAVGDFTLHAATLLRHAYRVYYNGQVLVDVARRDGKTAITQIDLESFRALNASTTDAFNLEWEAVKATIDKAQSFNQAQIAAVEAANDSALIRVANAYKAILTNFTTIKSLKDAVFGDAARERGELLKPRHYGCETFGPYTNPRNPIGSSRAINTPENTSGIGVIHFGKG